MDLHVTTATGPLLGRVRVPGDKSISHRAVLFAAMAEGESRLTAVLDSADVRSTIAAVAALGAGVFVRGKDATGLTLTVRGWGAAGPRQPDAPIDCGNSGTTARLLLGVLAGWPIEVTLTGDESLSRRPMRRVMDPLREMGASFTAAEGDTLPITMRGGALRGVNYTSPVASAQVKSAVLLAGLRAAGVTCVSEPALSRDHTERMLPAFGVPVDVATSAISASVRGPVVLRAADVAVPGDPSSAAFLAVAGLLVPGSEIELTGVCMNPTRAGFALVLEAMGADLVRTPEPGSGLEPVERLVVRYTPAPSAASVAWTDVPRLIDEVPVLALMATQASGVTRFSGVGELRVKESDRLEAVRAGLAAFGAKVTAGDDWLEVAGPTPLSGTQLPSHGDHRLAMTWAVAGLVAQGRTVVEEFDAVSVSYPAFEGHLRGLGASVSTA